TGSGGAILERYRYDVFGAPTILSANNIQLSTSAINNRFMFTGREYASTFGIYEYRARAYHPGLGRFTSEDPKGFDAGDYNMFRYCHNDPEDLTDPTGLGYENNVDFPPVTESSTPQQQQQIAYLNARNTALSWNPGGAIEIGLANQQISRLQQSSSTREAM